MPTRRADNAPTASTKNGSYVGVHSAQYNQDFFLGVPYAQPPLGDLRFRVPQSLNSSWSEPRAATEYSNECVGYGSDQFPYSVSEDCLYLNVVRPSGYENASLPVAFWIHGGGFTQGGGIDQRYNLSFIVQHAAEMGKPFIGVSINYRLSAWGFLSGEEVQKAGQTNIGLRDQRLALHWVQENIAGFGGDASKVTIFGESAGAASVGAQLVAYNGRDDSLFRGAIAQSGGPIYYGPLNSSADNDAKYQSFIKTTPCRNATAPLACLRTLDYETLNSAINSTGFTSWGVAIDGDFIAGKTSQQVARGDYVQVPIIIGANSDEGTAFSPTGIETTADFERILLNSGVATNQTAALLKYYPDDPAVGIPGSYPLGPLPADFRPSAPYGAQYRRAAAYVGDQNFIAPRRAVAEAWAAAGLNAWSYRFNAIPNGVSQLTGSTHFQEIAFVFNNLLGVGYYPPVSEPPFDGMPQGYADLAATMSSAWIRFFVDGNPNGAEGEGLSQGGVETGPWGPYSVDEPTNFVFDANVTSHVEPDTWRKEGIAWINAHALDVYSR
ncbi:Alpha/Beta hydrolase protein [Phyllosticta citricarpa]|uniref:Carboxylic ester hydrolase n=2 Tax=Phyllosticta TaxID=121621 RepID=A0ABR1MFL7_9PEZI